MASGINAIANLLGRVDANGALLVALSGGEAVASLVTVTQTALGTTSTDGIVEQNTTAATVGTTVQISPRLRWRGTGWDTDDAVSRTVDFFAENLPATGNTVTGTWKLGYSLAGGAATYPFTVSSAGTAMLLGGLGINGATATTDCAVKAQGAGFGLTVIGSGIALAVAGVRQATNSGGHIFAREATGLVNTVEFFGDASLNATVAKLSTIATNDDPTENFQQGRVATTDATVTTAYTLTIPSSTTYFVEAKVYARRTGGTAGTAEDGAGYIRVATVKNVAGTATLIGAVATVVTQEDQAGWDCTIDVTGATARVRVTGAVDNNVTWHAAVRAYPLGS